MQKDHASDFLNRDQVKVTGNFLTWDDKARGKEEKRVKVEETAAAVVEAAAHTCRRRIQSL